MTTDTDTWHAVEHRRAEYGHTVRVRLCEGRWALDVDGCHVVGYTLPGTDRVVHRVRDSGGIYFDRLDDAQRAADRILRALADADAALSGALDDFDRAVHLALVAGD